MSNFDYAIAVYKDVLTGKRKRFPHRFWMDDYASAPYLVRYLIEDILQWDEKQIATQFKSTVLQKYKLGGLYTHIYHDTVYAVIEDAYPGRFHPWEICNAPNKFWLDEQNCIKATRWLINEKKNWTKEDIMKQYNGNVFKETGFSGLLKSGWNGETFRAITRSFPEYHFQPWDIEKVPITELSQTDAIEAIRWFIEDQSKWSKDDLYEKWRWRNIPETIRRIVPQHFQNNMFLAIDIVYPNTFHPWDFPLPNGYWTEEHKEEACQWLYEEVIGKTWTTLPSRTADTLCKCPFFKEVITMPYEGDTIRYR